MLTTEVIQMDVEQKLYNERYRASIGSIYAFIIFQYLKIIPIILYNEIFHKYNRLLYSKK